MGGEFTLFFRILAQLNSYYLYIYLLGVETTHKLPLLFFVSFAITHPVLTFLVLNVKLIVLYHFFKTKNQYSPYCLSPYSNDFLIKIQKNDKNSNENDILTSSFISSKK